MYGRLFIPSWRLFDRLGTVPRLYVRSSTTSESWSGEWAPVPLQSEIKWWSLFLNPRGNLNHALCTVLDRTLLEPDNSELQEIIRKYVDFILSSEPDYRRLAKFQFKLTALQVEDARLLEQDVLISAEVNL